MAKSRFYEEIKSSLIEKEVESVYNKGINLYFTDTNITHPFDCDGYVDTKTKNHKFLKLIIEYKFNEALSNRISRAKILVQVIYYIKRFEQDGMALPNVCMVGDKDECFVLHTNELLKYLDDNVDWSIAPSNAAYKNPDMAVRISEDENINPFVFIIDESFSFKTVADKIVDLADNVQRYVRVTEHNIAKIYEYFNSRVVNNSKLKTKEQVALFIGIITDHDEYYLHPSKKNTLVTPNGNVNVDSSSFESFFSFFQRTYTPQEKMKFTEIADMLIEDTDRRKSGDFWTPTVFVDYAHEMISKSLGYDWKEKYVVYDCCCGSLNLTRDYRFKELYCSTLFESELEIGKRYNPEAIKFQFDFLNDPLEKMPQQLLDSLNDDKPIVFFLNPPYARNTGGNNGFGTSESVYDTMVHSKMERNKIGGGSENLQHQFMYRIMQIKNQFNLTNVYIALFSKPIYLTGCKQSKFLNVFCDNFHIIDGILFNASNFADVSDKWGITFNIWENGVSIDKNNFIHTLVEHKDGEIIEIGSKNLYNVNNTTKASEWVKSGEICNTDLPSFSSALKLCDRKGVKSNETSIGTLCSFANSVAKNSQMVALFSGLGNIGNGGTYPIFLDNFYRCTSLFSARKLITGNWINDKDEYLAPNENHPRWNEFVSDSIIYSLFHSASNQSSLRNVEYKGKLWYIKNEFCWYDIDKVKQLANDNNLDITYNDANTIPQRYVYTKLQSMTLSKEAQDVLDKANNMLWKSFKYRKIFNEEHPEYQILNADIGYYQLKALYKEYMPDAHNEFKQLYKILSDKMRPMVYELGFLKQ